jgi:hypothetical protein
MQFNESCISSTDCDQRKMFTCYKNKCVCNPNYYYDNQTTDCGKYHIYLSNIYFQF